MKKLLIFLLFPLAVLGQTPALNNFNRADFTIDARETPTNVVKLNRIGTNIYNILIVTNLYVTTNVYVNINGTNQQEALWYYNPVTQFMYPVVEEHGVVVTNLISVDALTAFGAVIGAFPAEQHLIAGTNNVATQGRFSIILEGKETNRVVSLQAPQAYGQLLLLMFSTNGGGMTLPSIPCYDYPLTARTYVRNNAWLPTQFGETIMLIGADGGWYEVSRANPNTNAPGAINPTVNYVPYNQDGILFGDSAWYASSTNIATDSQIIFGPGITNSLYRSAKDLVYTNGGLGVLVTVVDGLGNRASHGLGSGGTGLLNSSIGTTFVTDELVTHSIRPNANDTYSLGTENNSSGRWLNYVGRTNTIVGFNPLASDYSWTRMYQTDTNSPFVIDQQTAGTAGYSRGIELRTNGVTIASFTGTGGGGTYVARAGDTMTGALTLPNAIFTNNAVATVPLQINATNGTSTNLFEVNSGGTNLAFITKTGTLIFSNAFPQMIVGVNGTWGQPGYLKIGNAGTRVITNAQDIINTEICEDSNGTLHLSRNLALNASRLWSLEQAAPASLLEIGYEGVSMFTYPNDIAGTANQQMNCMMRTDGTTVFPSGVGIGSGWTNTSTLPLAGNIMLSIHKSHNFSSGQLIMNTNTGTGAYEMLLFTSDPALGSGTYSGIYNFNSGYTTSGLLIPSSLWIRANGTGGLTLNSTDASGVIRFATAGIAANNEYARLDSSGVFHFYTLGGYDASGSNVGGTNMTIRGGLSTGTGIGGAIDITTSLTSEATSSTSNASSIRAHYKPKFVALTHDTATTIETFSLAANKILGGTMTVTCYATNATPHLQSQTAVVTFDAVAVSTTITGTISSVANPTAASSGTLTCTYSLVDNTDNTFSIKLRANSDLGTPTERAKVVVTALNGNSTVTITDP